MVSYNGHGIISFDLEICDELVQDETGKNNFENIRISTAAWSDEIDFSKIRYYHDIPEKSKLFDLNGYPMHRQTAQQLVRDLIKEVKSGKIIYTWNGASFDFRVLAIHSGMFEECAKLALWSIDGMLLVTFKNGYFLGLDKVLVGAGLESKLHTVTLKDGTVLEDMSGMKAPELWRAGEFDAVNDYLAYDVIQPLKHVDHLTKFKRFDWKSKTGFNMYMRLPDYSFGGILPLTKDLFGIPMPDTSRFDNPPNRKQFFEWMPVSVLERYCPDAL